MRIGIVLLSDEKTANKIKRASSDLNEKFPCFFKLDQTHIPHATLLHADINDENLEKIIVSVENIANSSKQINVLSQDLRRGFMFRTLIGVYFKDESDILTLRQKILDKVGNYLSKISPNIAPHVTITRLKRDEDVDLAIAGIKSLLNYKFTFPSIGVCEIGENGACTSIIKSFEITLNISGF